MLYFDRVQETTATTGTGTLTLAGAVGGYQAFSTVISVSSIVYYCIFNATQFETGIGTYTNSGTTLSRSTVLQSSNSNSLVSLTGTSNVFMTMPALVVTGDSAPGLYCDGSDGVATFDGTATPTGSVKSDGTHYYVQRDVYYSSCTISAGVNVSLVNLTGSAGTFRFFCSGTLTLAGNINANGVSATSATAPAAIGPNGSIGAFIGPGGAGETTTGQAGQFVAAGVGGTYGGGGGKGGNGTAGNTGGAAGTASKPTNIGGNGFIHRGAHELVLGCQFGPGGGGMVPAGPIFFFLNGGGGGGGGGGDGTNSGGAGGTGASVAMVAAQTVTGAGTITATGGAGFTPVTGNCGGGGGAGGGVVILISRFQYNWTGTLTAAGGAPGNGVGTGAVGIVGNAGTTLSVPG